MCACEDDKRCLYHDKLLKEHQVMWRRLCEIDNPERRSGEGIIVNGYPVPYRHL